MYLVVRCHDCTFDSKRLEFHPLECTPIHGYRLIVLALQTRTKQFWFTRNVTCVQLARVIGKLMEEGWRPHRSIVLCSWDAEEYALVCIILLLLDTALSRLCKSIAVLLLI